MAGWLYCLFACLINFAVRSIFRARSLIVNSASPKISAWVKFILTPVLAYTHARTAPTNLSSKRLINGVLACALLISDNKYGKYSVVAWSWFSLASSARALARKAISSPRATIALNVCMRFAYALGDSIFCSPAWPPTSCKNTGTIWFASMLSAINTALPSWKNPSASSAIDRLPFSPTKSDSCLMCNTPASSSALMVFLPNCLTKVSRTWVGVVSVAPLVFLL